LAIGAPLVFQRVTGLQCDALVEWRLTERLRSDGGPLDHRTAMPDQPPRLQKLKHARQPAACQGAPDPQVLDLVLKLAREVAREHHAANRALVANESRDLRKILDRTSE
jgi:hypothetical protein